MWGSSINISELVGKTFTSVSRNGNERITFESSDGESFAMYHDQDCCESVYLEEVIGDLEDLANTPILVAYESSNDEKKPPVGSDDEMSEAVIDGLVGNTDWAAESETWTFYRLTTIKGSVFIRWYGSSNGYYSESVSVYRTREANASAA
jgi:hypothetical protein